MRKYETPEQRDRRQEQEGEAYISMFNTVDEEFRTKYEADAIEQYGAGYLMHWPYEPDQVEIHAETCRRLDAMIAERKQEAAESAHSLRMYGL